MITFKFVCYEADDSHRDPVAGFNSATDCYDWCENGGDVVYVVTKYGGPDAFDFDPKSAKANAPIYGRNFIKWATK